MLQFLADWLGVELLATELQCQHKRWQPLLAAPNGKGPEKVRRLEVHLTLNPFLTPQPPEGQAGHGPARRFGADRRP